MYSAFRQVMRAIRLTRGMFITFDLFWALGESLILYVV